MSTQYLREDNLFELEDSIHTQPEPITPFRLAEVYIEKVSKEQELSYSINSTANNSTAELHSNLHEESTRETASIRRSIAQPIIFPEIKPTSRQARSILLQKWEGIVLEVFKGSFLARLTDLTHKGFDEEAEFSIEEISEEDRKLIEPGAVFYWNIGYVDSPSGQRSRASVIRFRRLPAWSKREIEEAEHEADQIADEIGWK